MLPNYPRCGVVLFMDKDNTLVLLIYYCTSQLKSKHNSRPLEVRGENYSPNEKKHEKECLLGKTEGARCAHSVAIF